MERQEEIKQMQIVRQVGGINGEKDELKLMLIGRDLRVILVFSGVFRWREVSRS